VTHQTRALESEARKNAASVRWGHDFGKGTPTTSAGSHSAGTGAAVDLTDRFSFEQHFGRDFSQVRVHSDQRSDQLASLLHVPALTIGNHIYLQHGQYAPETEAGRRLLAHELTHVAQQHAAPPLRSLRPSAALPVMFATSDETPLGAGEPQMDPTKGLLKPLGLLASLDRFLTLLDIFGEKDLEKLSQQIRQDPEATKLTLTWGAGAFVALAETRTGRGLQPPVAEAILKERRDLFNRRALEAHGKAAKTLWFEEKVPPKAEETEIGTLTSREEIVLLNDKVLDVNIRIATQKKDWQADKLKPDISKARNAVLTAVAAALGMLESTKAFEWSGGAKERRQAEQAHREDLAARARMKEALRAFTSSRPLNIRIVSELPIEEEMSISMALKTDQIFVRADDLGNPAKLEAAIRIPLAALIGGPHFLFELGVPETKQISEMVLHESLHVMLVNQGISGTQIFERARDRITGPPTVKERADELVRAYLIAQDETFVYENIGAVSTIFLANRQKYVDFVEKVDKYLLDKESVTELATNALPVHERVQGKKVGWAITHKLPKALSVQGGDLPVMTDLLRQYPH
jgi:hypothetical protein